MTIETIAFVAAPSPSAHQALVRLKTLYGHIAPTQADAIVALGGDGFVLETLHRYMTLQKPIYGMNRGSVGFLMNLYQEKDLHNRLRRAQQVTLHPLRMIAEDVHGTKSDAVAINEVSLLRQSRQAAKVRMRIDGKIRLAELICDGVLVCTPAGSTAYNLSAHGPILPMGANVMALTPISAFRPRRWRGAILPHTACVEFEILELEKRPVAAVADYTEIRQVAKVEVREDRSVHLNLLFDPEHNLEERILSEQFSS